MSRKVAVVGASASGLYTALLLGRKGLDVSVHERAKELDPARRTLIVTSKFRDYLGALGESSIVNEINRFELFANGRVAEFELSRPDLIVERSTLIHNLAAEATANKVAIHTDQRFQGMEPYGDGLRLHMEGSGNDGLVASSVVGADGAQSAVASAARWPRQPTVPLIQAIVRLPRDFPSDTTRVWFRPEDTPYFYWLVPEGPERGALGVIGEAGSDARAHLDAFLGRQGMNAIEYQAARIPLYTKWTKIHRKVGGGHVYLVGDAAGQVKVSTVGGLVTGFRGALGVADAISGSSTLQLRSLQLELGLHLLVRKALHDFDQEDYVRLLDLLNSKAGRILANHTRDETPSVLWRICLAQPKLLLLGVRNLVTGGSFGRAG